MKSKYHRCKANQKPPQKNNPTKWQTNILPPPQNGRCLKISRSMSSKNPSLWRRDGEEAKHEAGLPAILAKRAATCHDSTPPKKPKRMKRNFSFLIEAEMGAGKAGVFQVWTWWWLTCWIWKKLATVAKYLVIRNQSCDIPNSIIFEAKKT